MRATSAFLYVLFFLSSIYAVYAWTQEDYEIFDLVADLQKGEGKGTTFYSFLNVSSTATAADISRAYKKRSLSLHPDKELSRLSKPSKKDIERVQARFALLGVIAAILRDPTSRERYDFFYKNGVPRWRGTGYYYSRFRPTIAHVLGFLIILISGLHYLVMHISYRQTVRRMRELIHEARIQAWGPRLKPQLGKKRVNIGGGRRSAVVDDDDDEDDDEDERSKNRSHRGMILVVEGDLTYIMDKSTGDLVELREEDIPKPSMLRTPMFRMPIWVYRMTIGNLLTKIIGKEKEEKSLDGMDDTDGNLDDENGTLDIDDKNLSNKQRKKLAKKLAPTGSASDSSTTSDRLRQRKQRKRRS